MDTILRQLPLQSDSDIHFVHNYALQLATTAGLTTVEQLGFASRVTQHCCEVFGKEEEIVFSIHRLEDRLVLRASTIKAKGRIFIEIAREPERLNEKPLFSFGDPPAAQTTVHNNRQLSVIVLHELKSSIANIKMAVSLLEKENVPETATRFVEVIHRASDRLEQTLDGLNEIIHPSQPKEQRKANQQS